ncbi:MAG: TonB-dependent receptor plug domain-containing protein, partial [Bacteroidota bacterium]
MNRLYQLMLTTLCLGGMGLHLLQAQSQRVSGTVRDLDTQEGLPGVTIYVKGQSGGTSSDAQGNFDLLVPNPQEAILIFSFVGYLKQEVAVNGQSNLSVTMQLDAQELEEIVVIGYGQARKSDLTGAVASVKSEELTQVATADVAQALQGRAAGVSVTSNSGEPGSGVRVRIRGTGTINNSDPLYVVDGFQTGNISFLNPNDIASIEVLKDASATAIYGSRGANGVIL